ncbi:oligopeptide ABC transporter (permease) [Weissella viridescens]|jgi:oligopeptide transport system permease protein|nr:ABC transporter permease [Weissella viridescens]MCB6840132.1 ABC transporter permease [Weissella viridescens]MCB6846864.1 ABC transporter permease [Weissella viridescens]GEA95055.1 peptide ABC transporter permease [Weissella viridescens]SOB43649.1 oligopeptide ABC transporter (permease) [Weissella viridescens]
MSGMVKYVLKRLGIILLTLIIIISITFFLMKLMPGSPLANAERLSDTQRQVIEAQYGLDKPLIVQYWNYLVNALQFNFGNSFQFQNQPVSTLIAQRIGPSAQLGIQALVFGIVAGIGLGAAAAVHRNTKTDTFLSILAVLGVSIPSFVFAALLQYYVGLKLNWLPIAGWEGFKFTILPTIALGMQPMATAARFIRTEMVDVMGSDYIELARAKGLSSNDIVWRHTLRNSLIPLVTLIGPMAVNLMTGSVVIEKIFAIPGIGGQFVSSILTNDYPLIMGTTIVYSMMLMVVLLITDILYGLIDPRIRLAN